VRDRRDAGSSVAGRRRGRAVDERRVVAPGSRRRGYLVRDQVGLGMSGCRSSTSPRGRQPIHNEDKSVWRCSNARSTTTTSSARSSSNAGITLHSSDTETWCTSTRVRGGGVSRLRGMFATRSGMSDETVDRRARPTRHQAAVLRPARWRVFFASSSKRSPGCRDSPGTSTRRASSGTGVPLCAGAATIFRNVVDCRRRTISSTRAAGLLCTAIGPSDTKVIAECRPRVERAVSGPVPSQCEKAI